MRRWTAPVVWSGLAMALLTGAMQSAHAQPAGQTIRIVFSAAAGGAGDALARILADQIQKSTGNSTIVENRGGAGGRLGVVAVKDAVPDGTTLLYVTIGPMVLVPHYFGSRLGYDPLTDFAPVSQAATNEFALAMANTVPVTDARALVPWLKADPKRATFAVPQVGTLGHFLSLAFGRATGIDVNILAYKGPSQAVQDVAAGQVPFVISPTGDLGELWKAGKLQLAGTMSERSSGLLPGVATMREQGVDVTGYGWYGLFAPARTPQEIVQRLSRIAADTVHEPATRERVGKLGLIPTGTTSEELAAILKRDFEYWGPIVKASGFKPEQ